VHLDKCKRQTKIETIGQHLDPGVGDVPNRCWSINMRVKLMLLLCIAAMPNFLPAQEVVESLTVTSALSNSKEPQNRLAREIAEAEVTLARIAGSAEAQPRETADATCALADLYLKAGEYERASPLIERALEIRRTRLGDKDRDTAASFQQLAEFREELGAFLEAEKLYRQALAVRKQADSGSVETAATLHSLGRLLSKVDNVAEAEWLLREALAIRKQKLSAQDVDIAYTLYELAKIEAHNGKDSEAHSFSGEAYDIFKAALGAKHPDTEDARMVMEAFGEIVNEKMIGFGMQIRHIPGGPSSEAPAGKTEDQSARRQCVRAHRVIESRQAIKAGGGVGVLGPQRLSADLECLLKEWFGLGVGAHVRIEVRQVVEGGGGVGVLGPQRLLHDLERLLVEWFGFLVRAHGSIKLGQVVEGGGGVEMLRPQRSFSKDLPV
jgi:tetratricopeptide (TPR) repeat protein